MSSALRATLTAVAVSYAAIAALLLAAPAFFYATIPGVASSGPYNAHFLRDVGLAYATLALATCLGLRDRTSARLATLLGAAYLGGHAVLHLVAELGARDFGAALREAPGVYGPAVLAAGLAIALRPVKTTSGGAA